MGSVRNLHRLGLTNSSDEQIDEFERKVSSSDDIDRGIRRAARRPYLISLGLAFAGAVGGGIYGSVINEKPVMPVAPESVEIYCLADDSISNIQEMVDSPYFSGNDDVPGREELLEANRKIKSFLDSNDFEDVIAYEAAFDEYRIEWSEWNGTAAFSPVYGFATGGVLGMLLSIPSFWRENSLRKKKKALENELD